MAEPYLRCPESWYRGTLEPNSRSGLIARVETGSTPSTSRDDYWGGGIFWLTPKEITQLTDGLYVSRTERTITEHGLLSCSTKLLPPGTVLLTKRAPVGAVAVNAVPMATNQGFLNFICGPKLRPLYLAYWFRVNRPYLEIIANGSTYPELYRGDLFEFEIAVPTLYQQDRILEVINAFQFIILLGSPIEQSVNSPTSMIAIQRQSERLRKIRDYILPLLLSGQLDASKVNTRFLGVNT